MLNWIRLLVVCLMIRVLSGQSAPTLSRPFLDTGVITLISSVVGNNSNAFIQYTKPSFVGAWIYLSICALDVRVSSRLSYKAYMHTQTPSLFKVELIQNAGSTFYKLSVRYHQYNHSDLYYSTQYCMLDLKYFDVANPLNLSTSTYTKSGHLSVTRSNYTSQSHRHKCIVHLTGVDLTGQLAVDVHAAINSNEIYIDYTAGPATDLAHFTVYVLVFDEYLARFQAKLLVEYGTTTFARGFALSNTATLNQTQTAAFFGITSFKADLNATEIVFDLAAGQGGSASMEWLTSSYLHLTVQTCPASSSLNIGTNSCSSNLRQLLSCAAGSTLPLPHKVVVSNHSNGGVQQISISSNKYILVAVTSSRITIFSIQSNNSYQQTQQIDTGFTLAEVGLSSEGLYLVVAGSTVLRIYKLVSGLYRLKFTVERAAARFTSAQIDEAGSVVTGCFTQSTSTYLLTLQFSARLGQFVIIQEQNMNISSLSATRLTLNSNATLLVLLSSQGYFMQLASPLKSAMFHLNATTRVLVANASSSEPVLGKLTKDSATLVVSAEPSAGLRIYHYDSTQQMYSLWQTLSQPLCMASIRVHEISITSSGLVLAVQALDEDQKYQLLYTRTSNQNLFELTEVLSIGQLNSTAESGLQLSADGSLLVTPVDGNNLAAYYCSSIFVNTQHTSPPDDTISSMSPFQVSIMMLIMCLSAALVGCCLFCLVLVRIISKFKNKSTAINPLADGVFRSRADSVCSSQLNLSEKQQNIPQFVVNPVNQTNEARVQKHQLQGGQQEQGQQNNSTAQGGRGTADKSKRRKNILRINTKLTFEETEISIDFQQS